MSLWERPVHYVTLSDFSIGQTEVTQELWQAVMGSNPSYYTSDSQLPVERVSWNSCQDFIEQLNQLTGETFRLPTEAEWEFAARGGNKSQKYRYSGSSNIQDVAWFWNSIPSWYGTYSSDDQINPTGPSWGSFRIFRGGSWSRSSESCRVAYRNYTYPSTSDDTMGFRLAL